MGEAPEQIVLVQSEQDVDELEVDDRERVAYITQTTLAVDETSAILARLRERFPSIVGPRTDDICYATTNRQAAVKQMAAQLRPDARDRLAQLVQLGAPGRGRARLRHRGAPDRQRGEVQEEWLEGRRVVGISSGASAPENLVGELVDFFRARGVRDISEFDVVREDVRFMLPKQIREAVAGAPRPDGLVGAVLSTWPGDGRARERRRRLSDAHADRLRPAPGQRLAAPTCCAAPSCARRCSRRVADVDRLVLLGDVLELRHGPLREALAAARPFFEDLGAGARRARARDRRGQPRPRAGGTVARAPRRRGRSRRRSASSSCSSPREASPTLERIAGWAAPARVTRRLSRPVGAPRRLRHARPLPRLPSHHPHARAPQRRRDEPRAGTPGRDVRERRGLRGDAAPGVRVARRRRPRRAHRRRAQRHRHGAAPGARSAAAVTAATAARRSTAARRRRMLARGRRRAAQARWPGAFPLAVAALNRAGLGPLRAEHLRRRAAPGGAARDGRGRRAPRPRRRPRGLRPHPPRRAAARR